MAELRSALSQVISGHGRLVMLAGEPGIGKTRTAQELALYAEEQGVQVLWGWCYEREGAPPYWPWVQPIREYIKSVQPEQLRSQMGPGAADIAEVIPEVRQIISDLNPPPELDPEQARFRLFDSIATFFRAASQNRPLILFLEDLHWADRPSLLLLEFFVRQLAESRILVVGTYRDVEINREHPLTETLARLYGSLVFQGTLLEGLESADVGLLIQANTGIEASQELVDAIYAHTEGNPFFIAEVIRLVGNSVQLLTSQTPASLGLSQGVREVINQRLNRLSARSSVT